MSSIQSEGSGDDSHDEGPWRRQDSLVEARHDIDGRGALGSFDVFALIVNKMVGTGIYTAPATVFLMTGNKNLTLVLFILGFAYSLMSMVIYLDYAKVLPFNGGELIYLDEIASHVVEDRRGTELRTMTGGSTQQPAPAPTPKKAGFFGDGLLVFIMYSISFVVFFNSGTNAMQFARYVLVCSMVNKDNAGRPIAVHQDLMRFIGVFVLSLICLFQYFSPNFGRSLNKTLAAAKIIMLLGILITAGIAAGDRGSNSSPWGKSHEVDPEQSNKHRGVSFAKAFLAVLFSFQGWENATFVTGEIPEHKHHVLRNGFITAVITVGCLYIAIVSAFLSFVDWDNLRSVQDGSIVTNVDYIPMFTSDKVRSTRAWAAMAAMSAFGNLNAIIYTFSRVKQAIGQADVLPWSRIWKQDDILQRHNGARRSPADSADEFLHKSPQGGLIVHWIFSVILILATVNINNTAEAVGLPGYLQTYIHCAVLAFLGMGFFRLKSREEALWPADADTRRSKRPTHIQWLLYGTVPIYVCINVAILIVTAIKPYKATNGSTKGVVAGWVFLLITALVLLISTAYYVLFFGAASRRYEPAAPDADRLPLSAPSPPALHEGFMRPRSWWNWMRCGGVQCEIRKSYTYDRKLERVYRFGRRWRVIYHLPGDEGYKESLQRPRRKQAETPQASGPSKSKMYLYWLSGGTRLKDGLTPVEVWDDWWGEAKRKLRNRDFKALIS